MKFTPKAIRSMVRIAAIQDDAREGMVPAAELRPTIEFLQWIDEFLKEDGKDPFGSSRCRTRNELTRLETLLGEKGEGK